MADSATLDGPGFRIQYSNTGTAITEGDVVPLASGSSGNVGIAVADIAATTGTGAIQIAGRATIPKATGEAMTVGQIVYWDDTNGYATGTSSTTFYRCGWVIEAAASAVTTVEILINGNSGD